MNVVIIGQGWLAAETLQAVAALAGVTVAAVSPEHSGDRFEEAATGLGVPVEPALDRLPACEVMLAAHCHRFVPAAVRAKAWHGVLAYHPSLLPRHRGRDAIHWTLAMRDPIAGGTVYQMDDGADTGPLVAQAWCHVLPGDTPQSLWRRALAPMGVRLLTKAVQDLARHGTLPLEAQDERAATWEPSLRRVALREG
ncbi:MAG: methionyl-tRNA formyltransferase [Desulfovibrio sp.]|nr:methionyl-tRNA formyltransferase [Desulfovibrio sp.]MCA1987166.1 methionyl-tRNA formyltransferase [Desulfovibrio sp.]